MASRKPIGKSSRVDAEVARLLSKPNVSKEEFGRLRRKMDDNTLVDQIQAAYTEKYEMVEKRAKAFAQKILEKYGMTNQPYSQLILKAMKYAEKYELSDAEKTAFRRILEQELAGANTGDIPKITTNMSKVLGDVQIDVTGNGMKVDDADYRELQDILKMRDEDKALHSQVILQSLSYDGSNPEVALNGRFAPENGHNLACHVHPVIAALFLPKVDELEHHFLYSNLANIVASRYNKEPFQTRPDYELFYNLISDPNDIVCDSRSPMKDLKNRCYLQKQLWNSVLALRNGQFYNCDQLDLMRAIDMCRLNKYDTPDLMYGRNDGTIVKRLFASLSFRPTLVLSSPTPQVFSMNPYIRSTHPTVSTIAMLNLRLPQFSNQYLGNTAVGGVPGITSHITSGPVDLKDALQQAQLFFENGTLMMKNTQAIESRGVLVFFVDRRKHNLHLKQYTDPIAMVALPTTLSGFSRVNTDLVNFSDTGMSLENKIYTTTTSSSSGKTFNLLSVVCAKTYSPSAGSKYDDEENKDLSIGSEAYVKVGNNIAKYDPMSSTSMNGHAGKITTSTGPINSKEPIYMTSNTSFNTISEIKSHGVVFVYHKQ
jgi:hypothetical protein